MGAYTGVATLGVFTKINRSVKANR